jgi:hypothetical protein
MNPVMAVYIYVVFGSVRDLARNLVAVKVVYILDRRRKCSQNMLISEREKDVGGLTYSLLKRECRSWKTSIILRI